jgi:GNAT superfamily N-acetyltransferase
MRIVRLDREDAELFKDLDPFGMWSILEDSYAFALGGIVSEGEESEVAALLIGMLCSDRLTIDWIAVHPDHQGNRYGDELLLKVFDMAEKAKVKKISAAIPFEMIREGLDESAYDYFSERLFESDSGYYGNRMLTLQGIGRSKFFKQDVKDLKKPVAFSDIPKKERAEVYKKLLRYPETKTLHPKEEMTGLVDPDISFLYEDSGEPYGGIIVQNTGELLIPTVFCAGSDEDASALIISAHAAAQKKYGKDKNVFIKAVDEKDNDMLEKIFGQAECGMILTAHTSDYKQLKGKGDEKA